MRKLLAFCISLLFVQVSFAQITLIHSINGKFTPHFQYYNQQEDPFAGLYYYETAGDYYLSYYSNTIPNTYYDENFNIIEQTFYNCTNNVLTIGSTGTVQVSLAPITLPQNYEVYSIRFSKHLFNADDLWEFYIILNNPNASYPVDYNNSYCRFIVNSLGTILSDTIYSFSSSGRPQHFMIDDTHYFLELIAVADFVNNTSSGFHHVTNVYTCSGPNQPTPVLELDTVFITLHDTIILTAHDTVIEDLPFYNLSVFSDNPNYGIPVGNGSFPQNCNVEIGAIPLENHRFVQWEDGNPQNPRNVNIQSDETHTAIFQPTRVSENAISTSWEVTSSSQGITIRGAEGKTIRLFDAAGRCLQTISAAAPLCFIPVSTPGVYLIQVDGGAARKVVIP